MNKNYLNIILLVFLIIFSSINTNAFEKKQQEQYKISILSIGEGSSLADAFGHTGIRITDKNNDIVFNFGIYDYNAPNFYSNFVKGRPEYKLGIQDYKSFTQNYIKEKRYVIEHQLNLDEDSTRKIINLLLENLKNPSYTYDYLRDNCATRVADILINESNNIPNIESINQKSDNTYRKLIHSKINENSWSALGIDLCLGAIMDKEIILKETFFLPENLMNYLNEIEKESDSLIIKKTVYKPKITRKYTENIPSPLLINLIFSLAIIILTIINIKNDNWTKLVDYLIFSISGLIGFLIIYLWFFSNHFAGAQNFNFLWAFPFNFIFIFSISKKNIPKWCLGYIKFLIILLSLLFLHWFTGVQKYNITLLPIFIALFIRYSFLVYQIKKIKK